MPDISFKVSLVRKTYRAYAARRAVLWPLMRQRSLYDDMVCKDVLRLVTLWRARIKDLKAIGWDCVTENGKLQFARNCPPELVITEQASTKVPLRPCRHLHICPWCAIRRVYEVYDAFAELLPRKGKTTHATFQLVEVTHSVPFYRYESKRHLDALFANRRQLARKFLRRLEPLGAYYSLQLNPHAVDGQKSHWKSVVRILAILPKDWVAPDWVYDDHRAKIRITQVSCRNELIGPVARVCRYPVGLFRCDPYTAMVTMNGLRGQKTNAFIGCLRGATARKTTNDRHENLTQEHA